MSEPTDEQREAFERLRREGIPADDWLRRPMPPAARFPIARDEAMTRMTDKLVGIELMFQPDLGAVSKMYRAARAEVEELIARSPLIEEAGLVGQRINMGIMFWITHPRLGPGWMFVETRPEARIPDDVVLERDREYAAKVMGGRG